MRRRSSLAIVGAVALATSSVAAPGAASGPVEPTPTPLAGGLLSPLSVAAADDGTVWFSQNYAGTLERRTPDGSTRTVAKAPGDLELAGVAEEDGSVWYTVTGAGHTVGRLHEMAPDGTDTVVADLFAHEQQTNPDARFRYGFRSLPPECKQQVAAADRGPHGGAPETHPVATVRAHGAAYLADAAANAITVVAAPDLIGTVVALPPVRTTMTADYAEQNGFPDCTVGRDFWAEAVPTDVEEGPYGSLYVTTLPGGPGSTDGRPAGRLLRVLILTGQVVVVADRLDNPTGVAVSDTGDVYVAELQANRISRIAAGTGEVEPYAYQKFPGDLEWSRDGLLATIDVLSGTGGPGGDPPAGQVVSLN